MENSQIVYAHLVDAQVSLILAGGKRLVQELKNLSAALEAAGLSGADEQVTAVNVIYRTAKESCDGIIRAGRTHSECIQGAVRMPGTPDTMIKRVREGLFTISNAMQGGELDVSKSSLQDPDAVKAARDSLTGLIDLLSAELAKRDEMRKSELSGTLAEIEKYRDK